jgi:hypothetical protein
MNRLPLFIQGGLHLPRHMKKGKGVHCPWTFFSGASKAGKRTASFLIYV